MDNSLNHYKKDTELENDFFLNGSSKLGDHWKYPSEDALSNSLECLCAVNIESLKKDAFKR